MWTRLATKGGGPHGSGGFGQPLLRKRFLEVAKFINWGSQKICLPPKTPNDFQRWTFYIKRRQKNSYIYKSIYGARPLKMSTSENEAYFQRRTSLQPTLAHSEPFIYIYIYESTSLQFPPLTSTPTYLPFTAIVSISLHLSAPLFPPPPLSWQVWRSFTVYLFNRCEALSATLLAVSHNRSDTLGQDQGRLEKDHLGEAVRQQATPDGQVPEQRQHCQGVVAALSAAPYTTRRRPATPQQRTHTPNV